MLHFNSAIRGFTLFEVLITVVIVGILTAIILPGFQDSVQASRRGVAKSHLLKLAQAQAKWRVSSTTYTNNFTDLLSPNPNPPNPLGESDLVNVGSSVGVVVSKFYLFNIDSSSNNSFQISAAPYPSQAGDRCGTLQIDQNANITSNKPTDCPQP